MPDDETVNQMIARHEEEFDLFMVSAARRQRHCSRLTGSQGALRLHAPHPVNTRSSKTSR